MKQRLLLILGFVIVAAALVALNAASVRQQPKTPDTELSPNRSTYNPGSTGTQALYALLSETGRKVVRWQKPPDELRTAGKDAPGSYVIIGPVRRDLEPAETAVLLNWVSDGGKLVVIDREPAKEFLSTTSFWELDADPDMASIFLADPTDQQTMIGGVPPAAPVHPSLLTAAVGSVQASKFASSLNFKRNLTEGEVHAQEFAAPVVHFRSGEKNLVVDMPYGAGRIVFLTDPYIVSNGGLALLDNAQLAINLVNAGGAPIAIDEYHQGFGSNNNRLAQYFAGTPVIAVFLQFAALIGLVLFSQSRRFARPVPEKEDDRLAKLEYIAAMAELQQRTRAYDLAVENIYKEFRRRVSRFFGVDNKTTARADLASLIAERTGRDAAGIDAILFEAEEVMYGEPTNRAAVTRVAGRLRELENALGLRRHTAD